MSEITSILVAGIIVLSVGIPAVLAYDKAKREMERTVMMMHRTDDPIADFMRREDKLHEALIRNPKCDCCNEYIQDDDLYDFDGELICPECLTDWLNDNYKKRTVDYIG